MTDKIPFKLSDHIERRYDPEYWQEFRERYWWWEVLVLAVAIVGLGLTIGLNLHAHHGRPPVHENPPTSRGDPP